MEIPRHTRKALAHLSLIGLGLMLIVFIAFLVLMPSCTSLHQPETKIITEIVAQGVGYLIAKEDPQLATEILKYTETIPDFENWTTWMIAQLIQDEFLRMNFEKLASLVKVDLKGIDNFKERMDIITPILRSFAEGIRMGLKK